MIRGHGDITIHGGAGITHRSMADGGHQGMATDMGLDTIPLFIRRIIVIVIMRVVVAARQELSEVPAAAQAPVALKLVRAAAMQVVWICQQEYEIHPVVHVHPKRRT